MRDDRTSHVACGASLPDGNIAGVGIVSSLPIGIMLALGRRSEMPVVRMLCVGFIELIRAVPLITVIGDHCTSWVSRSSRRWRDTVAWAGSGGASFDVRSTVPCGSGGVTGTLGAPAVSADSFVICAPK